MTFYVIVFLFLVQRLHGGETKVIVYPLIYLAFS